MNIKKLLVEVRDSGQRDRFYQDLIDMQAAEAEISYPDKVCPGPKYDRCNQAAQGNHQG